MAVHVFQINQSGQWGEMFIGKFSRKHDNVEVKSMYYLWTILYGNSTYLG